MYQPLDMIDKTLKDTHENKGNGESITFRGDISDRLIPSMINNITCI
jgi:hypothetical protein